MKAYKALFGARLARFLLYLSILGEGMKLFILFFVTLSFCLNSYGTELCLKLSKDNIHKVITENKDGYYFSIYRFGTDNSVDGKDNFSITTKSQDIARKIDQVIANLQDGAEAKSFCFIGRDSRKASSLFMDVKSFKTHSHTNNIQDSSPTNLKQ